jgi:hypothetical protein
VRANLSARLKAIERHRWAQPPEVLRGAYEVHCVGGAGRFEGYTCHEHQDCVSRSTPVHGRVRRQIIFDWHEGLGDPFDQG